MVFHFARNLNTVRGVLLRILVGSVLPGSPNPDPILDKKNVIFHTRFQTWPLRNDGINTWIRTATKKDFSKSISNFHISPSFLPTLTHLEMKRRIPSLITDTPVVPKKTLSDSRLKWVKSIPVFRPKQSKRKRRTWGGTYLYGLYKGVPPRNTSMRSPLSCMSCTYIQYPSLFDVNSCQ